MSSVSAEPTSRHRREEMGARRRHEPSENEQKVYDTLTNWGIEAIRRAVCLLSQRFRLGCSAWR